MALSNFAIGTLILSLLFSLGYTISSKDTHICKGLNDTIFCNHLSLNEKTCYPYEVSLIGQEYCMTGWVLLNKSNSITGLPESYSVVEPKPNYGTSYSCDKNGCNKVILN